MKHCEEKINKYLEGYIFRNSRIEFYHKPSQILHSVLNTSNFDDDAFNLQTHIFSDLPLCKHHFQLQIQFSRKQIQMSAARQLWIINQALTAWLDLATLLMKICWTKFLLGFKLEFCYSNNHSSLDCKQKMHADTDGLYS